MGVTTAKQTIVLTGVAGFIGSHTAQRLLSMGHEVVGVDNFDPYYSPMIKKRTLELIQGHENAGAFRFVEADICKGPAMHQLFESVKPTGVIHLAARAGVRPSIAQPALYAKVNVEGTVNLLEAARSTEGVDRFVMASSSSVYGNHPEVPFSEEHRVDEPISPYAATKRACELIGHTYHHLYGLPVSCLRFFTVFGPRQRPDLAIAKFIDLIERGESITMFGDGSTSRDYTYIDDIVDGVVASYERTPKHGFRIWNLGGNQPVTLKAMISTIGEAVGKTPRVEMGGAQPGDVERTYADLTRSSAELGYMPKTDFAEGVARQVEAARAAVVG